ncbi:MAG: SDR family oxidoreductase [Erysipelotrichaceae bacterium]|nr:SDR family oxidoreductase [Erysipelotrichaceae bacterium]
MADRLLDKVAIVTGATSGIGKAVVEAFAKEGAKVVFIGRRQDKGLAVESENRNQGGEVTFVQGDVTKEEDIEKMISTALEKYGKIDVLVNNAGRSTVASFHEYDMKKDYDDIMDLNIKSYVQCCRLVLPHMLKNKKGNIVNIASIGAITAMPKQVSYAVSKGGVVQLSRTIAYEYAKDGIRCNTICPGLTQTELVESGSPVEKILQSIVPSKTSGTAQGIAMAAVFMASDESPYMSGANLTIDGACTCGPCPEL